MVEIKRTVPKEVLDDIVKNQPAYEERVNALFLTEEEFKGLEDPNFDLEAFRESKKSGNEKILMTYRNLVDILKKYLDMNEDYYPLLSIWIMGTYLHDQFETYPYIYLNAMKGSGKTRLLKLMACLSKDGEVLASMKEAVLFRTNSTLAIDEFEAIGRKGSEDLRELLNAAYKKGIKVKRMKKKKSQEGEEQVVEEFSVFRPIIMANIWGMENVLSDRCFHLTLERSDKRNVTKLVELFETDPLVTGTKTLLNGLKVMFSEVTLLQNIYTSWNEYIISNIITSATNNVTKHHFKEIDESGLDGRQLELSFPLLLIAERIDETVFDNLLTILSNLSLTKMEEDLIENKDISLYDFIAQETETINFISIKELTNRFRQYLQEDMSEEGQRTNEKWVGRALKRLNLVIKKKHQSYGNTVLIDYKKAREKIRMFK